MKQLAFLVNSSTPSLQNIAHNLRHYFWLFQLIVTVFCISTLGFGVVALEETDSMKGIRVHWFVLFVFMHRRLRLLLVHKDHVLGDLQHCILLEHLLKPRDQQKAM